MKYRTNATVAGSVVGVFHAAGCSLSEVRGETRPERGGGRPAGKRGFERKLWTEADWWRQTVRTGLLTQTETKAAAYKCMRVCVCVCHCKGELFIKITTFISSSQT